MYMNPYIELVRPKTLPLAFSVIILGNALAAGEGQARWTVFILQLVTALSLQILSNIANDYGDGIRGTDAHRQGPRRMLQSGLLSPRILRFCIVFFAVFCFACGIAAILAAGRSAAQGWTIFALGVLAIAAAIGYTVGRHAYGYYGLGEIAVFLFFGWLGVAGSYALQAPGLPAAVFLPASGAGILAAAVLHINNMRDIESDARAGRKTPAICLGFARARLAHAAMLAAGLLCYTLYALRHAPWGMLWLLALPWIILHAGRICRAMQPADAGREMKAVVLLNLGVALLFAAGVLFS